MSDLKLRGGHRAMATKLIDTIKDLMQETEIDIFKLSSHISGLKHHKSKILQYDDNIQLNLEEDALLTDMEESSRRLICIEEALHMADNCLASIQLSQQANTLNNSQINLRTSQTVKLPTLNLPLFDGNPLDYSHFWDMFNSSVNSRTDISDSQKFSYLMGQLKGEALSLLEGFTTTDSNYKEAINLLKETFGDPKRIIQSHLHALFDIDIPNATAEDLSKFRSSFECHIRGLKALNTKIEEGGFIIAALLLRKLPSKIRDNINRAARSHYWELEDFRKSINEEISLLQAIEPDKKSTVAQKVKSNNQVQVDKNKSKRFSPNLTTANFNVKAEKFKTKTPIYNQAKNLSCKLCFADHSYQNCNTYSTPKFKSDRAKQMGLCLRCLLNNHSTVDCRSKFSCECCQGNHNTALCYKVDKDSVASATTATSLGSGVALPIATILIKDHGGARPAKALFDQGSQRTFILKSVANALKLKVIKKIKLSVDGFQSKGKIQVYEMVEFKVILPNNKYLTITALCVKDLPSRIHMPGLQSATNKLLKLGVVLADQEMPDNIKDISLLIGADNYFKFITGYKIYDDITVLSSRIGGIIVGQLPKIKANSTFTSLNEVTTVLRIGDTPSEVNVDLEENTVADLERLWKLDHIGINTDEISNSEKKIIEDFENNIRYEEGKYIVGLPWKKDHPFLPSNYNLAKKRLMGLLQKLRKFPSDLDIYNSIIKDQLHRNFIEIVDEFEPLCEDAKMHYLAHHPVKKDSATTPIRIVFDCSAGNPSLNDCLYSGPSLVVNLCHLLLRFRTGKFACCSDIEKAYLNIALRREDQDSTRFLWPEDPFDPCSDIKIYRFKVVLFGSTCSQYLLNASIRYHLRECNVPVASKILQDLYVDNLISTFDKQTDMQEYYHACNKIFRSANLTLREWMTNCPTTQNLWYEYGNGLPTDTHIIKVLGLNWNITNDFLSVSACSMDLEANTKRKFLSNLARIFDPLGFLTPVTITGKIFLQTLWKAKLNWDDIVEPLYQKEWRSIASNINSSFSFMVPRNIIVSKLVSLHAFSDASGKAYGTVVYAVGDGNSWFLMSKGKVAPIKTLTIPRLELTAFVLSARLLKFILESYNNMEIVSIHLWTDSQIVLQWLSQKNPRQAYIQNRIDEVYSLIPKFYSHFVSTSENPSDMLSRGISSNCFMKSSLWLHGPSWLIDETQWPLWSSDNRLDENSTEVDTVGICTSDEHLCIDIGKYNSYTKLLKITALLLRFIHNCRSSKRHYSSIEGTTNLYNHNILPEHIEMAETCLVKYIQRNVYNEELCYLQGFSKFRPPLVNQINLFESKGIIRVRRRIDFSNLEYESKFPILIPKDHQFTRLIINKLHNQYGHPGVSQMMVLISHRYYFSSMRQVIKKVLRHCMICRKLQGTSFKSPPPPPLPENRVVQSKPFSITGVDYTGALLVKSGRKLDKVYIVLFTCATTRAVHMELVDDISGESFLRAFRRFVSRRSLPSIVLSDNATNFLAASQTLISFQKQPSVQEFFRNHKLEWRFTPAKAPWFGGIWERLIGLTKNVIKKVLGNALITRDELFTVIMEVEMLLNDRPLMYVDDPLNSEALSPSDLMYGYKLCSLPTPIEDFDPDCNFGEKCILSKRQKHLFRIKLHLWKRWMHEYLVSLRDYHSKVNKFLSPTIGEIVLIQDDHNRLQWKMGKIIKLHQGIDGYIRSAVLRTSRGVITRPVVKLYPLELYTQPESQSESQSMDAEHDVNNVGKRQQRKAAMEAKTLFKRQLT